MAIVDTFDEVLRTLPPFNPLEEAEADYPSDSPFESLEELYSGEFDNFATSTTEISEIPEDLISQAADALSDEEKLAVAGGLAHQGLDVLAFYKSYRFLKRPPFAGRWGIFYVGPLWVS